MLNPHNFGEFMDFELFPVLAVAYKTCKNISPMHISNYRRALPQASRHHDTLSSHYIAIIHEDLQNPVQYVEQFPVIVDTSSIMIK